MRQPLVTRLFAHTRTQSPAIHGSSGKQTTREFEQRPQRREDLPRRLETDTVCRHGAESGTKTALRRRPVASSAAGQARGAWIFQSKGEKKPGSSYVDRALTTFASQLLCSLAPRLLFSSRIVEGYRLKDVQKIMRNHHLSSPGRRSNFLFFVSRALDE